MLSVLRAAAAAALLLAATPTLALAHHGLVHGGCDPNATFTAGPISVSAAFTRAMPPNAPSAGGYLTIVNSGPDAVRLVGASSEAAGAVQLHEMKMEGDMMKMGEVEGGIEIPAGGRVELKPAGGYHLMFTEVGTPFKEGECVQVTLHFDKAGDLPIVLSIGGAAANGPPEHAMDPNMKM